MSKACIFLYFVVARVNHLAAILCTPVDGIILCILNIGTYHNYNYIYTINIINNIAKMFTINIVIIYNYTMFVFVNHH